MKIRLAEILDMKRMSDRLTLKSTDDKLLMEDDNRWVKLSKYKQWWVVRVDVDDNVFTISEEETDCEYISDDIGGTPKLFDITTNPENPKYMLSVDATEEDLNDEELALLKYGRLPHTNYHRVLQLPVRDLAGLIELFAGHSCGCDKCEVKDRCEYIEECRAEDNFKYSKFFGSQNCDGFYKWLKEPYSPAMFDKARERMKEYGPFVDGKHFPDLWYHNGAVEE